MRHFDIVSMSQSLDFINLMTYDIHGTRDANIPSIGNRALAHADLTEMRESLDLLWRNNINPAKINLGIRLLRKKPRLPFPTPGGEYGSMRELCARCSRDRI